MRLCAGQGGTSRSSPESCDALRLVFDTTALRRQFRQIKLDKSFFGSISLHNPKGTRCRLDVRKPKMRMRMKTKTTNTIITLLSLSLSLAGGSLFLTCCSKSAKSGPGANNSSSPAASSANGGSAAAGPVDLKIKWQTGKVYNMEMDLNQATDINVHGQPVHQVMKLTQGLHYSPLKDLDAGRFQVQLEFERQNFDFTQNGKDLLSFDSTQNTPTDTDGKIPLGTVMRAMLGVPLDYTFAADGTIEKIDGIDTLSNRIVAAVPDQRQRMMFQQLFDENTLKQYGAFSRSLPGHPVNIGDTWSSSQDMNDPAGVMTVNCTYTFKSWESHNGHNCAHILITGDIKTKSASASTIGAVVNVKKGIVNGDAWFDPDLGMFVDINSKQDTTLDITTRGGAFTEHMKQNVDTSLLGIDP